ncbi:MAG: D-glycerate dehydrogenase [Planctomycetota bacterium]
MSKQTEAVVRVTRAIPGDLHVKGARVEVLGDGLAPRERVLEFVRGASAVVSMFTDRVDAELLDAAGPGLLGVCQYAVGHDNIDLEACRERGVVVTNTPDAVTEGTANLAWLLVLGVARRLIRADRYARSAAYPGNGPLGMGDFLGKDLAGRTLLIVGAGRIGQAVALRAQAWGMRTLYVARTPKRSMEGSPIAGERVELHEGLARADVVSVHAPLTEQTRHLLDDAAFGVIKPGAIVVNTARGAVIDEAALVRALEAGRLWGAGLDVYEQEPRVHPALVGRDDVVLTPHIGSAEVRFREQMTEMVLAAAGEVLAGREPMHRIA